MPPIRIDSFLTPNPSMIGMRESCQMALKTKTKRIDAPPIGRVRKAKFQADLAPAEDRTMRVLKEELQLTSNTDFLSDALALFRWAVSERKLS